jgi:hypothetical protein
MPQCYMLATFSVMVVKSVDSIQLSPRHYSAVMALRDCTWPFSNHEIHSRVF